MFRQFFADKINLKFDVKPMTTSYTTPAMQKNYNATSSLVRLKEKNYIFCFEKQSSLTLYIRLAPEVAKTISCRLESDSLRSVQRRDASFASLRYLLFIHARKIHCRF
jgi:hypothetical protein